MMRLVVVIVGVMLLVTPVAGLAGAQSDESSATNATDVTLRVTVVNAQGSSLGNAEVTVSYGDQEQTRETVSNGEVLFDVPDDSTVEITAEHPMLVKNGAQTVDVDGNTDVTVTMFQAATTTVTVQDTNGNPVSDANVWLRKDGASRTAARGTAGVDGTFSTPEIESGEYVLRVSKPGYYDARQSVTLSGDSEQTVEVEQGRVSVDFSVVDPNIDSGEPIRDARISVADADSTVGTFSTDSSGSRGVTLDVNTDYTVTVEKDGYESITETLRIGESDESPTFEIARTPELIVEPANTQVVVGQNVRVTVTDEYGERVSGADVRLNGSGVATTDENGEAMVTIESAGDVEIAAVNGTVRSAGTVVQGVEAGSDPGTTANGGTATDGTTMDSPATDPPATENEGGSPGFGVGAALVALVAVALVARGRR